jgi:hypothetical protein
VDTVHESQVSFYQAFIGSWDSVSIFTSSYSNLPQPMVFYLFIYFFGGACVTKHWLQVTTNTLPLLPADGMKWNSVVVPTQGNPHYGRQN